MSLSYLTQHSNLPQILLEHRIKKNDIKEFIQEKIIQITDTRLPIQEKRHTDQYWTSVTANIIQILAAKFEQDDDMQTFLAMIVNKAGLVANIADEITSQLKNKYQNQGIINRLRGGDVEEKLLYSQKFGTYNRDKDSAEYLHITGSGRISCGQKIVGANEVILDIEIQVRAVTIRGDEIQLHKDERIEGGIFGQLSWVGVKILTK